VGTFTILGGLIVFGIILVGYALHKNGRLIATAMDAVGAAVGALVLVAVLLGSMWIVMKCVMLPFEILEELKRHSRLLEQIRDKGGPALTAPGAVQCLTGGERVEPETDVEGGDTVHTTAPGC
jgi:hypothetical protein